jgi:HEAT repeat protein
MVIEQVPVVIEKQTVIVQPQQFDDSTIQLNMDLQYRKSELLKQLQAPDKELRRGAIRELAGFSFDDNVRCALENILLSDSDAELRAEAACAFGTVKNANAKAALEKARVEDPSADVRRAADEAIRNIEGN